MVRHGFGREVSKTEMQENLARSRELGLVLCADNVKKDVSFICHCCGCCCNVLLGISKLGYPGVLVTSNYMAHRDPEVCTECDTCVESCAIGAIAAGNGGGPEVDEQLCVGCGVCEERCFFDAVSMAETGGAAVVDEKKCMGCGICLPTCPVDAITYREIAAVESIPE